MFWFLFTVALAAGSLGAVCFHLHPEHPRWRPELKTGMFWSAVVFLGAFTWMIVDIAQDWAR